MSEPLMQFIHWTEKVIVQLVEQNLTFNVLKFCSQFERAIIAAGTDFRSDKLWDLYIDWEKTMLRHKRVLAIYDRLLPIPTHLYSHHFEKYV